MSEKAWRNQINHSQCEKHCVTEPEIKNNLSVERHVEAKLNAEGVKTPCDSTSG